MAFFNSCDEWECECGSTRWAQDVQGVEEVILGDDGEVIESVEVDIYDSKPVRCASYHCAKPFNK